MANTTIPRESPLVSQGSRFGPVFNRKDQCAFVKVSRRDNTRAVVNLDTMTLVQYAEKHECPSDPVDSDQSLFVPIFCKECYGTEACDYTEALAGIALCGAGSFLVGVCSVFGVAEDETYPEARRDFIVGNELSFSGACHPQPGKALFMHKTNNEIGRVKCYWHVHSRSADKTFLYCCVACAETEYAAGVVKPEMSMGFSLGTAGDNKCGPVTEECSLVSVPMRPGCFCVAVGPKDLPSVMTRMGFSSLKDHVLDAGAKRGVEDGELGESSPCQTLAETVQSLKKVVLDQATEVRVLRDVLEAIRIQNDLFTRMLGRPCDGDALFTFQGAKEFTKRTGVKTKLCAGVIPTDRDANVDANPGDTVVSDQRDSDMALNQTQVDELLKLLPQQQHQQNQPQQNTQQAQLQALQNLMQLAPMFHWFSQPQKSYVSSPQHQRSGEGTFGSAHPTAPLDRNERSFDCSTLSEEQKRRIAMEYNKEESERQAVSHRQQEKMLDSIKASIRDVMLEQQRGVEREPARDKLLSLASDTPYKRVRQQSDVDDDAEDTGLPKLLRELRELTRCISKRDKNKCGDRDDANPLCEMETEPQRGSAAPPSMTCEAPPAPPPPVQQSSGVAAKQQAGYTLAHQSGSQSGSAVNVSNSVADFISAVVAKN